MKKSRFIKIEAAIIAVFFLTTALLIPSFIATKNTNIDQISDALKIPNTENL